MVFLDCPGVFYCVLGCPMVSCGNQMQDSVYYKNVDINVFYMLERDIRHYSDSGNIIQPMFAAHSILIFFLKYEWASPIFQKRFPDAVCS